MKTRNIFTILLMCLFGAAPLSARQFEKGEMIYVNADQSGRDGNGKYNWSNDNAKLFLYIWKENNGSSNQQWLTLVKENGAVYSAAMPSGEFNRCIVVRKNSNGTSGNWDNKLAQTGDIHIPEEAVDRNQLSKFWEGGDGSEWLTYLPTADKVAAAADALRSAGKQEMIVVCPGAWGGPFSLRVKLNSAKTAYDYDNVRCHGWFKSTNGTTWTSVDEYAGKARDGEQDKDVLKNNLPASGPVYYYLHSAKTAGRRLVKVTADGAKDCDLDCTITAFEVACSAVNANDTTYTLDGMVAFGEPNGDLVIECDGKSVTIKASEANSPQIFSVEGLRAALENGKTTTARAYFKGNSGCSATAKVNIPNATQGTARTYKDVLVGDSVTLSPNGANYENDHKWFVDGVEDSGRHGEQTSLVFYEPNTTAYIYREFKTPPDDMKDMMENGGYESTSESFYGTKGQKSTISDYNFWGQYAQTDNTAIDFYTNTTINPDQWSDNGFAVVKNANNFFYTFANIQPREGAYFALFDAASGSEMAGKKAWKAETAKNTKLLLQKGTTYLFSFWAANINNYGEMDNAAKLQFQIEYNNTSKKLGEPLDLNSPEFRNNRWHQCSATFTADADAANVTISVVNLNNNGLKTGNDFALDDIQFRAVSSPTHSVRIQEVITVRTHEPHMKSLTASPQSLGCDSTAYKVTITVKYDNPKGNIVIEDQTAGKTVINEAVPAVGSDWDKEKTASFVIRVPELKGHAFKAYFAEWPKAETTGSSAAPEFDVCCTPNVMYRKWENVLFIENGDGRYKAFQWYKDGKEIEGATKQSYYAGADVSLVGSTAKYHCEMTFNDNSKERSCQQTFDETPRSAEHVAVDNVLLDGVTVYPTQVAAGAEITISKTVTGPVQAALLTLTGQAVSTTVLSEGNTLMTMPAAAGMYLLQLRGLNTQRTIKINVF